MTSATNFGVLDPLPLTRSEKSYRILVTYLMQSSLSADVAYKYSATRISWLPVAKFDCFSEETQEGLRA